MSSLLKTFGIATFNDLPTGKSSTASWPSHHGVVFSSLWMAETHTDWGFGLK